MAYGAPIKRLATPIFRIGVGRRVALRLAARRERALVLLYHRVRPDGTAPDPIVPSLPRTLFRDHLQMLQRLGDVVPLPDLLEPPQHTARPRFAITFDDDYAGYVETVLPELRACGVRATFFLSGRALHDLPPYWWSFVEDSLRTRGFEQTRHQLGLDASTPADLALALERSPDASTRASALPLPHEPSMTAAHIRALANAGMTIGFHTLHHPVLSRLSESTLSAALTDGRKELAAAARTSIDFLAYPHGQATSAVAAAAQAAPYAAAFATGGRPITLSSDRFLLQRWEPGALTPDDLAAAVALRLMRAPTAPQSARS